MRRAALLAAALLAVATPPPAEAQVAVDSIDVTIYAPGDILVTIAPRTFTGLVGDTITFTAVAIDAPTGDTIPDVLLRWSSPDPSAVSIDPMTGHATFLNRGKWRIRVEVERVGGLVLMEMRGGDVYMINGTARFNMIGQTKQLCTYLINLQSQIIARSPTLCPIPGVPGEWHWAGLPVNWMLDRWSHLRVG